MPPCSCATPGKKPGTSSKVTIGMLNAVAKAHETGPLARGVNVQHPCQHLRLLGDDAHAIAAQPRKPHHNILRVMLVDL